MDQEQIVNIIMPFRVRHFRHTSTALLMNGTATDCRTSPAGDKYPSQLKAH